MRLMPAVVPPPRPYNVSELFWPAIALPTITFALLYALAVPRGAVHPRPRRAPPARPAERPPGPHRDRRGRAHLLRRCSSLAGGQDIWAQQLDVSLSAVLWTFRVLVFVLPVVFGVFTYKFCRDLERHRHAARAAAAAEPPIGPNEPPSIDVSTGTGRRHRHRRHRPRRVGSTGCGAPGSGSSSCSCCAAPAPDASVCDAERRRPGFTGPDHRVGALAMDDRELAAPGAALARLVEQLGEQSALDGVAGAAPRTRRRGHRQRTRQGRAQRHVARATRCTRCSPTSRSASGPRRSLSTSSADGTRAGRPPAWSRGACSRRLPDRGHRRVRLVGRDGSEPARRLRARGGEHDRVALLRRVVGGAQARPPLARRRARTGGRDRGDGGRLPGRSPAAGAPGSASTTPRSGTRRPSGRR